MAGYQNTVATPTAEEQETVGLRQGLRDRLSSLVRGSEEVVDRIAVSVKEVARSSLAKQALDARERGNLPAAFWLLDEAYRENSEAVDVARDFWDVAVAYGRASDAAQAARHLVTTYAEEDHRELASQYWTELVGQIPEALVDARSLTKLLRTLEQAMAAEEDESARELRRYVLVKTSQAMVHPNNEGLTPGIAFHLAQAAREFDRPSAVAAAKVALESESLHEAKRAHLLEFLQGEEADESRPGRTPSPRAAAESHPLWCGDREPTPISRDELKQARQRVQGRKRKRAPSADEDSEPPEVSLSELEVDPNELSHPEIEFDPNEVSHPEIDFDGEDESPSAPADQLPTEQAAVAAEPTEESVPLPDGVRFSDARIMRGEIAGFSEDKISFSVAGGRTAKIAFDRVHAIAVAEIDGVPGLTIDLVLNWNEDHTLLRSVKLSAESFSAEVLATVGGDASMELRDALAEILDRSRAVPLPDPDSVLGVSARRYPSIAAYEREVLQLTR